MGILAARSGLKARERVRRREMMSKGEEGEEVDRRREHPNEG